MHTERTSEIKAAVAATPLVSLLPPALPWFLRSLNRYPIATIVVISAALLVLRSALRAASARR